MLSINYWTVGIAALITAIATGLGALPFLFFKQINRNFLGVSNAVAAGLMVGASAGLIIQGFEYSLPRSFLGVLIGVAFIAITHNMIHGRDDLHIGNISGADARKAILIVGVMTLHSFSEGVGVGVSFGDGQALGELITAAIAIHNIPEGVAISLVLIPRGTSVLRAGWWSIFSSLPQPLMAVPAFLFVEAFQPILPVGLGFAAGAMLWMVFSELVPDALEDTSHNVVAIAISLSITAMLLLQRLLTQV
jgi:zinc transporter ZupT